MGRLGMVGAAVMVVVGAAVQGVWGQTPNTDWYNATATSFTISTADELAGLAQIVNGAATGIERDGFSGKTITLVADVDLSGYAAGGGWVPIGNAAVNADNVFSGTFDGGRNTISDLAINRPGADYQGLFGHVVGGKVKNLGLVGVNVRGRGRVGGIVGRVNDGSIDNCYSTGVVSGTGFWYNDITFGDVGGVVGLLDDGSNLTGSYSAAQVSGLDATGGVVGSVWAGSSVANSYSIGAVSGEKNVGGVTGVVGVGSSVTNSYAAGAVIGTNYGVGGIAGYVYAGGNVINCAALNPAVKGSPAFSGGRRVNGHSGSGTLSNNVAYAEMKNEGDNTTWPNKGAATHNGADITNNEINANGTIGGLFTSENGWTIEPGKLPGFGKAVDMPEHLKLPYFMLRYSAGPGGRLMGEPSQSVDPGSSGTTVVAIADAGYAFVSWSDGVTVAERTDENVMSSIAVTAIFAPTQCTLHYIADPGGHLLGTLTQTVEPGSNGEAVTAVADDGYVFVSWSDGVTTAERTDENVMSNITVTATFAPAQYTLRYILGDGGREIIGGGEEQKVTFGSDGQEVYVLANTGYTFARWSDGSTDNPRTDRDIQGDLTVTAYFMDPDGNVSVLSSDRVIPGGGVGDDIAVVAPVNQLTAQFTVGPNPVNKRDGVINFFRQGRRFQGAALTVFDASGNVVNRIFVSDNDMVAVEQSKRIVGSWDLRDSRGRPVSEGTYLVRGVITTADGVRERVSIVVGVR